jgi:hypothetical protein
MQDVWTYRDAPELGSDLIDTGADISGYSVEALDGSIGKVDEATYDLGRSYLVVDTGPWIFGKKVMLPAGVVRGIDEAEETIFVNRTKDEIKAAPELDPEVTDDSYRDRIGSYYGPGGSGYRDWNEPL